MGDTASTNKTPTSGGFNPTQSGQSPLGIVPVAVAGMAAMSTALLSANAVWDSGVLYYNGNTSVDYQIFSDVSGALVVTYYNSDGSLLPFTPANVSYDPTIIASFQSAFNAKGYGVRFVYTNGATAQTKFQLSIGFSNHVQQTLQSLLTAIPDTNLAGVVKGTVQAKQDATGTRKELTGTASGTKFAVDVNVVNPTAQTATDVSALAKDATLTNGTQKTALVAGTAAIGSVSVSNLPATQPVSGNVGVNNFPATQQVTGTVAVSNFPTTQAVSIAGSVEVANDAGNPLPINGNVGLNAGSNAIGTVAVTALPSTPAGSNVIGVVSVNNLPATQPVSGTFFQATQPVSLASSPLPTGASTEATLATAVTALNSILSQITGVNTDQGTLADAQATNSTASWGEIALLKGILQRPATGTSTAVNVLATQSTVLAANALRKGAALYTVTGIYISLGATCSATVFTTRLSANSYYEVPFGYTGIITSFGAAATVQVTELT